MKRMVLLIVIGLIYSNGSAQNFSGEIIYSIQKMPKSDSSNLDMPTVQNLGDTASYIITNKRYKSIYFKDGKYNYSYTYDDHTKRMYDDYLDRPYVTFRDSRKANYEYYDSRIFKDSTITVLGHKCYLVESDAEFGVSRQYYSEDVRVNYADFEGHKVGNWYNKLKAVDGAITLKSITELETYYEIREAIEIKERKVELKEFDLPDKEIVASQSALDVQIDLKKPTEAQIACYQEKVSSASTEGGEKVRTYVKFILLESGKVKYISPYGEDVHGVFEVAKDIVENCGFQFIPGKLEGVPVASEVYFPVDFMK